MDISCSPGSNWTNLFIYIWIRYNLMSHLINRSAGTGIFDDEDNSFMSHDTTHDMTKQEKNSSARNFLIFFAIIVVIIVFINRSSLTSSSQVSSSEKVDPKKQFLQPVLEVITPDERELKQRQKKNQTILQDMSSHINTNLPQSEEKYNKNLQRDESKSFQPQVPSVVEQAEAAEEAKATPYLVKKTDKKQEKQVEKQVFIPAKANAKVYPVSQEIYDKRIYAGQIHYSRIPVEYWQHRILMLKAMGLNSLSVYVMWNYHEIERGKFDYTTQNKNITKFLELAVKHKMKVLLRPGPYICGEWDFGGLPARLLGIDKLTIRSSNALYLEQVQVYFQSLAPLIKPFLLANNGPIHMIQIQNELGSHSADQAYTQALVNQWKQLEVNCKFYIQDAAQNVYLNYFKGAAIGLSDGSHERDYSLVGLVKQIEQKTLIFGGEIYTGWMTHWGQRWGNNPFQKFRGEMQYLFQTQKQFSLYMAHGGTNFGLTAGANAGIHDFNYQPMITSYDYNATISEQGRRTVKSDLIVDLMRMYVKPPEAQFPDAYPTIKFEEIYPKLTASLIENLGQPALMNQTELYFFQHPKVAMYNQGIIVYQTFLTNSKYILKLTIHDFALIFLDGELIDKHSRIRTDQFQTNLTCKEQTCRLLILVEAMGHNNYGIDQGEDIKGLLKCKIFTVSQQIASDIPTASLWNFYKINIDESISKMNKISTNIIKYPSVLKQQFNLTSVGDTYINMENYNKGYVWINGRNLGRYWSRGPQFRLYCPGVWLKKENNEIVILQLLASDEEGVSGAHKMQDSKK